MEPRAGLVGEIQLDMSESESSEEKKCGPM